MMLGGGAKCPHCGGYDTIPQQGFTANLTWWFCSQCHKRFKAN
jgi:transposase-like protein